MTHLSSLVNCWGNLGIKRWGKALGTGKKRIQAYVSDAIYHMLEDQAQREGVSISEAAAQILSTYSSGPSSPSGYVTREEMITYVTEAVTRAETVWEAAATQEGHLQRMFMKEMAKKLEPGS